MAFTTSGIDGDVASATVTFSDGTHSVTVNASAGVADLSGLDDGPVSSVLNVTDGAGNTASANGAAITLDTTADGGGDLALSIGDTLDQQCREGCGGVHDLGHRRRRGQRDGDVQRRHPQRDGQRLGRRGRPVGPR